MGTILGVDELVYTYHQKPAVYCLKSFVGNVELNSRRERERSRPTSKSQIPALNVINGEIDILSVKDRNCAYESSDYEGRYLKVDEPGQIVCFDRE